MSKNDDLMKKMQDFDKMVAWFEGENFAIDEAIEKYKMALDKSKEIEKNLMELKNKITKIEKDFSI